MNFDSFFTQHFNKTQSIIRTAELSAGGWSAKVLDPSIISSPQSFGYIWDKESNFLWMFSAEREPFAKVSAEVSLEPKEIKQAYQDGLSELIRVAAAGSNEYGDWVKLIGPALVGYTGTTRTWELADRMRNGGNFIVCRYKNKMAGVSTLRPLFVGSDANTPMEAMAILELLDEVYETDKANHPEWFE